MLSFLDMSIRTKVIAAFAIVLAAALALGGFAIDRLARVNASAAEIRNNWLPATGWVGAIAKSTEQYRGSQGGLMIARSQEEKASQLARINEALKQFDSNWRLYEPTVTTAAERAMVAEFKTAWTSYLDDSRKLADLVTQGDMKPALDLYYGRLRDSFGKSRAAIERVLEFNVVEGKKEADLAAEVYRSAQFWIFVALGIAAALCAIMGLAIVYSVSRPIAAMTQTMHRLAGGDMTAQIGGAERKDEIGQMAKAVAVFRDNAIEADRLRTERVEAEKLSASQRRAEMETLANDFERAVGEIVETVSSASTELEASATSLTSTAERAQELATTVAGAAEVASSNVQSVASATEELSSSVNEIGRQVQESARIANNAVHQAASTSDRVSELSRAAARIGDVVELINTIAGQTNLLALNATIEAARAGDAGRGFAVVASEVKALAEQTAKATGEIGQQVTSIQSATADSVSAIREISGTIATLSEISSTIAAAVEEQGAATQEISRNVQQAARGTREVSSNVVETQRGASETGSASEQVLSAARRLATDSGRLRKELSRFLSGLRAA